MIIWVLWRSSFCAYLKRIVVFEFHFLLCLAGIKCKIIMVVMMMKCKWQWPYNLFAYFSADLVNLLKNIKLAMKSLSVAFMGQGVRVVEMNHIHVSFLCHKCASVLFLFCRADLQTAVENENYVSAASLRDEISELEVKHFYLSSCWKQSLAWNKVRHLHKCYIGKLIQLLFTGRVIGSSSKSSCIWEYKIHF